MRVQIIMLTLAMLVGGNQKAQALPQASTVAVVNDLVVNQTVKDVQIRFLSPKNKLVDDKGQPIVGRTHRNFIIGNLKLKPGQAFREDTLQEDLQRLRRLDVFDRVNVSVAAEEDGAIITYDIKEHYFPELTFGGGSNGDVGVYVQAGYEDGNINGVGDRFNFTVQPSTKDVIFDTQFTSRPRRAEANSWGYSVRAFRNRDLSRTFNDDIKLANNSTAREGRVGGSVSVLKSVNDWDTAVGINYTRISLRDRDYNVARVDRLGNQLSVSGTGIDDLVTVSLAVSRDLRDRRSNPTRGSILTLSTEQAIPIGLGQISSNRLRGNYIQYVPVSWVGHGKQTEFSEMVAFNLQVGTIIGDFPPADAFDLGGNNSVRGYGGGKVGSGRSYGLASVEYRFPIMRSLGGVVFADFASDFDSGKTVLGEPGVLRNKPGIGYGYGIGLRAKSPIGQLRGDLGINDQGNIVFILTTGQRF